MKNVNRIKTRLTSLLLAGMITMAGCGDTRGTAVGDYQPSSERINLTMWHYYTGDIKTMVDGMIHDFNETMGAEKNIYVTAYSYSTVYDLSTTLIDTAKQEVGAEDMPDIFLAYNDNALLLDQLGVVATLDNYFTEAEIDMYQQDFLSEGRFDDSGSLKIIPCAKSTEMLFVNDTDFSLFAAENNIEYSQLETWEGLLEVAEIYYNWTDMQTEEELDGKSLFGIDSETNFILITAQQFGEDIYDYSGDNVEFILSEKVAKKIWDYYIVPYIKGYYVNYGNFRSDDVRSGDILMYTGSTTSTTYFPTVVEHGRTDTYDIEGYALPLPYFSDGEKVAVQQGAGVVVAKSHEERESASVEFIKWFTNATNNLKFTVLTGYIPVQNAALNYDSVINVLKEGDGKISQISETSADALYNEMMPDFRFYATYPFTNSFEARYAIGDYVNETISVAMVEMQSKLDQGESKAEILEQLSSDESFQQWYKEFMVSINSVLSN